MDHAPDPWAAVVRRLFVGSVIGVLLAGCGGEERADPSDGELLDLTGRPNGVAGLAPPLDRTEHPALRSRDRTAAQ